MLSLPRYAIPVFDMRHREIVCLFVHYIDVVKDTLVKVRFLSRVYNLS